MKILTVSIVRTVCLAVSLRPNVFGFAVSNLAESVYGVHRALDIKISKLGQDFGGSDDVPAQLLHSLAGVCGP
jgi:hypothetical protein